MNSITFDGRVVADSELKYTQGGDAVLSFRVASDIGFGEKKTTNWFGCQVWGKRAEALLPYLIKGQQVTVYGQLTLREWTDRDGIKRLSPDVRINEVSMQGGKRDDAQQPADSNKPPRQPARSSYGGQKPAASKDEYPY